MISWKDFSRTRAAHGFEDGFSRAWTKSSPRGFALKASAVAETRAALFAVLERARARSLVDLLHSRPLSDLRKPEDLRRGERRIAALQLQLMRATGRANRQRLLEEILSCRGAARTNDDRAVHEGAPNRTWCCHQWSEL